MGKTSDVTLRHSDLVSYGESHLGWLTWLFLDVVKLPDLLGQNLDAQRLRGKKS
jgi:hypothetical protein